MAELELKQAAGDTYYIPSPTNVGVYVAGQNAILIDSGSDEEAARQILRLLQKNGLNLTLIINTHSHADHIGGNQFLQKRTGCAIAATQTEAAFIENPALEAAVLYGGNPYQALDNKFLRAKASAVQHLVAGGGPVPGTPLTTLSLPGHSWDMIGIRTPDQVVFLADSLLASRVIAKYHLFYLWDIAAQLHTLELLRSLPGAVFIPSHDKPLQQLQDSIATNQKKVEEIMAFIREICVTALNPDEIFQWICRRYSLAINENGYVLTMSTIHSYLACMERMGLLTHQLMNGELQWLAV